MAKELDLLFGVICPDCHKLITVYVRGTPKDATAKVIHGGKVCEPAPIRVPVVTVTGRHSCNEPNLQNVLCGGKLGKEIGKSFVQGRG